MMTNPVNRALADQKIQQAVEFSARQAERRRLMHQANATLLRGLRRSIGALLIAAGRRVHGSLPEPAVGSIAAGTRI